jgi:hypothetical protein
MTKFSWFCLLITAATRGISFLLQVIGALAAPFTEPRQRQGMRSRAGLLIDF